MATAKSLVLDRLAVHVLKAGELATVDEPQPSALAVYSDIHVGLFSGAVAAASKPWNVHQFGSHALY